VRAEREIPAAVLQSSHVFSFVMQCSSVRTRTAHALRSGLLADSWEHSNHPLFHSWNSFTHAIQIVPATATTAAAGWTMEKPLGKGHWKTCYSHLCRHLSSMLVQRALQLCRQQASTQQASLSHRLNASILPPSQSIYRSRFL
jgi:hypothetical protein